MSNKNKKDDIKNDDNKTKKQPNDNPIGLKDLGKPKGIQNDPEC